MNKFLALAIMVMIILPHSTHAQDAVLSEVYSGSHIANMWWSADSRVFAFQGNMNSAPEPSWYAYDVTSRQLTNSQSWPLQPTLNRVEQQALVSQESTVGQINLVFSSPNEQFLVGASENLSGLDNQSNYISQATISNRTTNTVNFIGIPIITQSSIDRYRVQWSDDSSAFVISTSAVQVAALSFFQYVTGYTNSNSANVVALEMQSITIDGQGYSILEVFDLSSDGSEVLVFAWNPSLPDRQYRLILWHASDDNHQIIPGFDGFAINYRHAVFAPTSRNQILVFNELGVSEHSVTTGENRVLYAELNATRFVNAMFSPDGHHIALVERVNDAVFSVYIVAL